MDVAMLATQGFVSVDYPNSLRRIVQEAMASWQTFCELPMKQKVVFSNGDRHRDFGYMLRQDHGPRTDYKELFHVSQVEIQDLETKAAALSDGRALTFMRAVELLIQAVEPLVSHFAHSVEKHYQLPGFREEVMNSRDHWTFRYLHYFSSQDVLAHPHVDRGGFTLHLGESHSGGEYLGFDRQWVKWPINGTRTIFFPSMALQYRSRGALKALCHRVLRASPEPTDRYAMVAFIDFQRGYRYDDAAGRLQEFEPGFNYNLPFEELAELFVLR